MRRFPLTPFCFRLRQEKHPIKGQKHTIHTKQHRFTHRYVKEIHEKLTGDQTTPSQSANQIHPKPKGLWTSTSSAIHTTLGRGNFQFPHTCKHAVLPWLLWSSNRPEPCPEGLCLERWLGGVFSLGLWEYLGSNGTNTFGITCFIFCWEKLLWDFIKDTKDECQTRALSGLDSILWASKDELFFGVFWSKSKK